MNENADPAMIRILDAALNRASEGLRVVEDYLRMVLGDGHLAGRVKQLRHDLAQASKSLATADRLAARDTLGDVGTANTTASEQTRSSAADVAIASSRRVAESLRTIEEYGKVVDATLAATCEQLRYQWYTLEKAIGIATDARERLAGARLYVLADGRATLVEFEALVSSLVEAGVGVIQLRDKSLSDAELLGRAQRMVALTRGTETLAILNDRADIAVAARADGVHLGQDDLGVAAARRMVGTRMLVGVSTHAIEQARQAVLDGANYLGAGPTFVSTTKSFDEFPGLGYLRQVASEVSLPVYAIGGITAENLQEVMATGIERVAVAGAVTGATDPGKAARELLGLLGHSSAAKSASGV
jgi:thiamine-phosphate pyrophosphorylase